MDAEIVVVMKIIDLDAELFTEKTMVAPVFEIDGSGIHMAMNLMNQETTVLLRIVVLGSQIRYFETVEFFLISRLVDVITKEQYSWRLYHKFCQLF